MKEIVERLEEIRDNLKATYPENWEGNVEIAIDDITDLIDDIEKRKN